MNENDKLKGEGDQEINLNQKQTQEHRAHPHSHNMRDHRESLLNQIKKYVKFGNDTVTSLFESVTTSFDLIIANSDFPLIVKRIVHAKQILITLFIFNNNLLLSQLNPGLLLRIPFYFALLAILMLHLFSYAYKKRAIVTYDAEFEQFLIERNPELRKNFCESCKVIRPMRSQHCCFCGVCITKFDFHSDWFNICVASHNGLIYLATMSVVFLYFSISLLLMIHAIFFSTKCAGNELVYHIWLLIFSIVVIKSAMFFYNYIKCLQRNLTQYEYHNQQRLTYLFKDASKEYSNPFDKGSTLNMAELLFNFFNEEMTQPEPEIEVGITQETEDEPLQFNRDDYRTKDLHAFQQMLLLNKPLKPYVSNKGFVYRRVNGANEVINWNKLRIYTILDIENSEFKELLIKQAHTVLDEYKRQLKEKQKA